MASLHVVWLDWTVSWTLGAPQPKKESLLVNAKASKSPSGIHEPFFVSGTFWDSQRAKVSCSNFGDSIRTTCWPRRRHQIHLQEPFLVHEPSLLPTTKRALLLVTLSPSNSKQGKFKNPWPHFSQKTMPSPATII